jgi:sporulation protein YlmC with PRC-barrel domain
MTLKSMALALGLALAVSPPALAQTTPTPPPATTPSGQPMWYAAQPDEMRASKLIGTSVVNTANETIGDVNEIILGKDGRVAAVIIGVGGFLGMGEREVAVSFGSLQTRRDDRDNLVLVVNATKDGLKSAPEWRWNTTKR